MLPLLLRAVPKLRRWFYHSIIRLTHPFYRLAITNKLSHAIAGADVVHSLAHGDLGWAALKIARRHNVPFVCTPFVHPNQWGDGPTDKDFYRQCDAVIGLVNSDADYLETLGVARSRLRVIGVSPNLPLSADPTRFRSKYGLGGRRVVLYVGRMMAKKGAAAVVDAAKLFEKKNSDACFVFIGPASKSEAQVFANAPSNVMYLGKVDWQDKADAYAACDVFCMPSLSEILPTVYLEAWFFGKPVIGGLAEGLAELVAGNDAGMNVEQDAAKIAEVLSQYLEDEGLARRQGANGRQMVEQHYSLDAVGKKLEILYNEIVATRLKLE
jgi:glycosyltransferase involved in cell wall biosynthesis